MKGVQTLYLQVQQGTLLPHGDIDEASLEWVPVNTTAPRFLLSFEQRKIDLDDLQAPPGYALTGDSTHRIQPYKSTVQMPTPSFSAQFITETKKAFSTIDKYRNRALATN